ncbi:type II CRISPR RNA-guided endonuclease Cas9 [Campylobacter jejuni]|nr:type II CRISPR RNA-guided endonuclease Cas9 [Campylobacter jejuni]
MARILAFDIGISSIGWAFSENDELKDCGVRIFTKAENPKTGESLALPRRLARSARKRLARRKARLNHLKHLIANEFKLNYEDYQSFDESLAKAYKGSLISPYELRFRALNELLSKQDFARVILHIAKRRGYDDIKNSDDKEKGAILKAIKQNEEKLANYQSVGEYLYKEYFQKFKENSKEFTNVRNKKESYERCIAQSFLKDELKLIFKKQREFGFSFSKKFEEEVLSVAFYKRALKDFSHLVGNCSFFTDEKRAPKNSPLAFMFVALTRIINLLNNLKNTEGILYTKDDLNALLNEVLKNGTLTYKQTKKLLGLSDDENTKLNDTQKGSKVHVEAKSGMLTSALRHTWGFSAKDRNNHLHHAIDAVIIAYANNSIVKAFSDFKKEQESNSAELYAKKISELDYKNKRKFFEPFSGFRQKVLDKIDEIFVSKPERKKPSGALHEETFTKEEEFYQSYGGKEGVLKALELGKIRKVNGKIVKNGDMFRVDIFKHKKTNKFYAVPIYTMDFALKVLPNKAVARSKKGEIKDWILMDENYEFCFSLYKDSLILIQTKDMQEPELVYFNAFTSSTVSLIVSKHDNKFETLSKNQKILFKNANEKEVIAKSIGIQNLKVFEKYIVSALGEVTKAEFRQREDFKNELR